jgi:hypothetical protein
MTTDQIASGWVCIITKEAETAAGNPWLEIEHGFGPFDEADAISWADQFNAEHDGQPLAGGRAAADEGQPVMAPAVVVVVVEITCPGFYAVDRQHPRPGVTRLK